MIKAQELVDAFHIPLNERGGYIWGTSGQTWTKAKQETATRPMTKKYGSKWIGHKVWDCSGMFVWAYKRFGESIYHGSNTIWKKYCSVKGELKNGAREDGMPIRPGTAVFLYRASDDCRHHIGLYCGNGVCIEAKGTYYGVVTSKLSHWDEWGELSQVDYSGVKGDVQMQILRKGSRGDAVRALQQMLIQCGYGYIIGDPDGIYGAKTEAAVTAFQKANGLVPDGVAGEQTQTHLAALAADPDLEQPEDNDSDEEPSETVKVPQESIEELISKIEVMQGQLDGLAYIARGWID